MFFDTSGHFTHGKAHVSIDFVPYLYRKAMIFVYRCVEAFTYPSSQVNRATDVL
jgi:hypothetical protein